jgi:hypothetical protein
VGAGRIHTPQRFQGLFRAEARGMGDHHFRQANDGVERRAQLVAHAGQELRLALARLRQLPALVLDFGCSLDDALLQHLIMSFEGCLRRQLLGANRNDDEPGKRDHSDEAFEQKDGLVGSVGNKWTDTLGGRENGDDDDRRRGKRDGAGTRPESSPNKQWQEEIADRVAGPGFDGRNQNC